jgi:hypothetical protein
MYNSRILHSPKLKHRQNLSLLDDKERLQQLTVMNRIDQVLLITQWTVSLGRRLRTWSKSFDRHPGPSIRIDLI